jgi:Xaa-Pro aminopeptidase
MRGSVLWMFSLCLAAQPALPPLREQAATQQQWLKARLERVLPALMRKHDVAMWLVISREYNEDPVFFSLVSPTTFAARRRTIYVLHDRGPELGIERLALGGVSQGGLFTVYRDPQGGGRELLGSSQWQLLRKVIDERKPKNIAIDISQTHAFADGLTAGEREQLEEALGADNRAKLKRAELLALEYVETRLPEMLPSYRNMMENAHSLISRAFSNEVIRPGVTTNEDVVWWLRQKSLEGGFGTWFQPSIRVQKPGKGGVSFLSEDGAVVIERGDVLHVDFGLSAMRLNTDTQHMGYVLRDGEKEPPPGLVAALEKGKRMQDLLLGRMKPGLTGNAVLSEALADVLDAGIKGSIYTHPIGDHGHGAGPLIGLWDRQQAIPGRGDVPLKPGTWFSIELSAKVPVSEWGGAELFIGMEEEAHMREDGKMEWVLRRQEKFHLVR